MAMGKKELTLVMVAMAMVVMSSMGEGVAAAPCFPLGCAAFVLERGPVPTKTCCIEVQDQFLLKELKSVGIGGYCKAVKAVKTYSGPLEGEELASALSIPDKCGLGSYYSKGFQCAGKGVISGGI